MVIVMIFRKIIRIFLRIYDEFLIELHQVLLVFILKSLEHLVAGPQLREDRGYLELLVELLVGFL